MGRPVTQARGEHASVAAGLRTKLDDDGDSVRLGGDCASNDPAFSPTVEWYGDVDGLVIGTASGALAGDLVAGAPDMDGDGDAEVVVGDRGWSSGGAGCGETSLCTRGE